MQWPVTPVQTLRVNTVHNNSAVSHVISTPNPTTALQTVFHLTQNAFVSYCSCAKPQERLIKLRIAVARLDSKGTAHFACFLTNVSFYTDRVYLSRNITSVLIYNSVQRICLTTWNRVLSADKVSVWNLFSSRCCLFNVLSLWLWRHLPGAFYHSTPCHIHTASLDAVILIRDALSAHLAVMSDLGTNTPHFRLLLHSRRNLWRRNIGWGCLRMGCWGEYLGLRGTR
jgi:hypothetical protein